MAAGRRPSEGRRAPAAEPRCAAELGREVLVRAEPLAPVRRADELRAAELLFCALRLVVEELRPVLVRRMRLS